MAMHTGKLGMSVQDKLAKQNEMSRQMLVRELTKLEDTRKSDIRMMETAKQRFRSRYKKLGVSVTSSGSEANDVRMYETHNPGFCYHCTGAIKESGPCSLKNPRGDSNDSYEVVRAMLLTDGEVDIDKVLCLHLLAAHTMSEDIEGQTSGMGTSFSDKDTKGSANKKKLLSGAWNNMLPCYVLEYQRDDFTKAPKPQEDHRRVIVENDTLENFQSSYESYVNENAHIVSALTANDRLAIMAPRNLGKMPIISPHVYSLLGASHELRVKQAIAEGNVAMRYNNKRSNIVDTGFHDVESIADAFRLLEPDENLLKSRMERDASSARVSSARLGSSRIYDLTKSHSRRSATDSCYRLDRSITMLRGKPRRPIEELVKTWRTCETNESERTTNDIVTIKPSHRKLVGVASRTSSAKSPFRAPQNERCCSINSIDSFVVDSARYPTKKYHKRVYLNSPVKSFVLRTREYRTVAILVNYKIQALVHSVLDVLEQVNPAKVRRIVESARDPRRICEIFQRSEIQRFVESLVGQPLVSSPRSFVASAATAVDEFDARLESFLENEIIATSLELPEAASLETLVDEIRDNIFFDGKKPSVSLINESSKTNDSPTANNIEESAMFVENQRKETPRAVGEATTQDRELPMKCKTEKIIAANKSSDGIRAIGEFDKVEGKLVASLGETYFNKIINDSTSMDDANHNSLSRIVKSSVMEKSHFKGRRI